MDGSARGYRDYYHHHHFVNYTAPSLAETMLSANVAYFAD